jgi:uncharacterized protein
MLSVWGWSAIVFLLYWLTSNLTIILLRCQRASWDRLKEDFLVCWWYETDEQNAEEPMKQITENGQLLVLRVDRGQEAISEIIAFCKANNISAGVFNAIGAVSRAELAFYDPKIKQYVPKNFTEDLEVTSMIGNIGISAGELVVHAHGTFSDRDFKVIGGHIVALVVSGTLEVIFTKLTGGSIVRELNADTNLNLMV